MFATDMDGDGDTDILSRLPGLIWHENIGNQTFIPRVITSIECRERVSGGR